MSLLESCANDNNDVNLPESNNTRKKVMIVTANKANKTDYVLKSYPTDKRDGNEQRTFYAINAFNCGGDYELQVKSKRTGSGVCTPEEQISLHADDSVVHAPTERSLGMMHHVFKEIIPILILSLSSFSFGIMLGWPSPTYPVLLNLLPSGLHNLTNSTTSTFLYKTSHGVSIFGTPPADPTVNPLPITLLQSPLIAGFLMFGTILTTPYSGISIYSTRLGVLAALIVMLLGWILLWQATNLGHLLLSRFLIGMGNGFALGQIKRTINSIASSRFRPTLLKMINILFLSGVLCAYAIGTVLDYTGFALCAIGITTTIYLLVLLAGADSQPEEKPIEDNNHGICAMFRMPDQRRWAIVVILLTFVQQFVGVPATLVYCQFLMTALGVPMPPIAAIGYLSTYICAYLLGSFYFERFQKKAMLLLSLTLTAISILCIIASIYTDAEPLTIMSALYVYIFVYGIGVGTVPNSIMEILPIDQRCKTAFAHLQLICFCAFAVVITKLFQVFYSAFADNYIIFILFFSIALMGIVFVCCFIPKKKPLN